IHEGAGDRDYETLPAGMVQKLARVVRVLIHRVLARHFHVAAERYRADAVVGFGLAETEQPFAEADREDFHPYFKEFGRRIMAPFVNQDHYAQHDGHRDRGNKKMLHKFELLPRTGNGGRARDGGPTAM